MTTRAADSVVIVGASLAGLRCATTLRREGFVGTITLIGEEPHLPYDRPPLSKQFLAGEWEADRFDLLPSEKAKELDLTTRLNQRAVGLDPHTKSVELQDGTAVHAEAVVIASGARPRLLPDAPSLDGVHVLRTLDDAERLRTELADGPKSVLVVGAGFIGAEVAATAHQLGHTVTVIEAADVPMERGLGREIGLICGDLHTDKGVDLRLGTGVSALRGSGGVSEVELSDGSLIAADVVVVGIGVVPNIEWLDGSGLTIDNGVVCNGYCEAAPGIYAAGDVARWPNSRFGNELMRVEHWENAVEQGSYVGRRIAGNAPDPFAPVPWFWSDQYNFKIQLAGRPHGTDTVEIVTGSVEEQRFAAIYGRGDQLTGVFGLNRPRHVMQYRKLIEDGASWNDALAFAEG